LKTFSGNWPSAVKRTKPREKVLAVLQNKEQPVTAADIYSEIEKDGGSVSLSTVYRILEFFETKELVIKTVMRDSKMALYELNRFEHKHYAVCVKCHKIIPMLNCPMEAFTPEIQDDEFRVIGHNLEVYGYCKDCSSANPKIKGEETVFAFSPIGGDG